MQFAECIIKHEPLPVMMHDIYKLRNNMAIELLSASGLFPLICLHFNITVRLHACMHVILQNHWRTLVMHVCGMNGTLQDTDNAWVSIASCICYKQLYSIIYAIDTVIAMHACF